MDRNKFTVIMGGAGRTLKGERTFLSAYATDTRLMGVVGLSIRWEVDDVFGPTDHYQFFYYDAEEYGLETYRSHTGSRNHELDLLEQSLIGGLGGKKVPLTEKEARYLLQKFARENQRLKSPLPEPQEEYDFLLKDPVEMTGAEKERVFRKICTPIKSNYHLIHYFLMRCLAGDAEGAERLTVAGMPLPGLLKDSATLCLNSIEDYPDETGQVTYLCEALTECENRYHLLVLEVAVKEGKVNWIEKRSGFQVTAAEAAMMLNRPEFVTIYEILTPPEEFDSQFLSLMAGAMQTAHDNGRLFLEFNTHNDHVNNKVFRLNEDIHTLFYVSDFGQLILAAYSLEEIQEAERSLKKSSLGSALLPAARYEFKEPVLYDFIQSDCEDFNEFLDLLNRP